MQATTLARQMMQSPRIGLPRRSLRSLYSHEQTHQAIHRERCRSDRSGQEFSLVLLRAPRSIGPSRTALRLAHLVLTRSRGTDDVGWFDGETVCAILPDTSPEGAGQFADQVILGLRDSAVKPVVAIYTYPSQWFAGEATGKTANCEPAKADAGSMTLNTSPDVVTPPLRAAQPDGPIRPDDLLPFLAQGVTDTIANQSTELASEAASQLSRISNATLSARSLESLLSRPVPWWKRLMDVGCAVLGLAMLSPVIVCIAAAIKLDSKGPIIFKQRRSGLGGKPFHIYKFRTMGNDAEKQKAALRALSEQDGPAFKLTNDPRITRVGKILRKTSLDELPQLWNVIRGEMSLVGPRPLPVDEQNGCMQWQRHRLDVTPGLTCIWQITGRSEVSFADWVRMDVNYIRRRNIWNDIKIIAATIPAVLLRRGAR